MKRLYPVQAEEQVSQLIIPDRDVVLDYGAGKYGRNAEWLKSQGIPTYAYDLNHQTNSDGWEGVSRTLPNDTFDIAFSSYLLNVVPEDVESQIISNMESRTNGTVFHIVRGGDIADMIWANVSGKNKKINHWVMDYIRDNYPEYQAKIEDGTITEKDAKELAILGVQSEEDSFQRIPDLTKYGYKKSGPERSRLWMKK